MQGLALLFALALVAAPATPQEAQPEQAFVWKGTLGDTPITACFFGEDSREGVFYTDAALEPVRLEGEPDSGFSALREMRGFDDPTGAVWSLARDAGGGLAGTWRSGADTRPIRLAAQAVTLPEYGSPCETGAFLDPLLAGGTVTSKRESLGASAYTVLDYTGPQRAGLKDYAVTSFALDPDRPGDEEINRVLAAALPDGTASHPAGQCLASSLVWSSGSGDYSHILAPELITPRWVGVTSSGSSFCGGAHPSHFSRTLVYDRQSGAEVDPAAWFMPQALRFYGSEADETTGRREISALAGPLLRAVLARFPAREDRAECRRMAEGDVGWTIGLRREGPVFVPQFYYAAFACTEEIVLPWKAARRFLSPEGQAVMASLR